MTMMSDSRRRRIVGKVGRIRPQLDVCCTPNTYSREHGFCSPSGSLPELPHA